MAENSSIDAVEEARWLWALYGLSKSKNSGMEAYQDEQFVKGYGVVHEVDGMDSFSAIPGLGFRPDGNDSSKPVNRKRSAG